MATTRNIRFNSIEQIEARINRVRELAQNALERANLSEDAAKLHYRNGMRVEGDYYQKKAERARKLHGAYISVTLPKLGEKLAEFKTGMLFPGMDTSIPARLGDMRRK